MDLYGHGPIPFLLRTKGRIFELDPTVVEEYLPGLWGHITYGNIRPRNSGYLELEDVGALHDPTSQRALCYLFDYLQEFQNEGVSAALDNSLEHLWKASKSRSRSHHSRRHPYDITEVFGRLGKIFDEDHFGCNDTIFTTMVTFFVRHCAEIMRLGRRIWVDYLFALERMCEDDEELVPALACIAQQRKLHQRDIEELTYHRTPRGHMLHPATVDVLWRLVGQKHDQDHQRHRSASGHYDPHSAYYSGGRNIIGGPQTFWGGHRGRRRVRHGDEIHPQELMGIAAKYPETIIVDERIKRRSHHHARYLEDDYSDTDSELDTAFDYGHRRRPGCMSYARQHRMIEPGGQRGRSMSMDSLNGTSMGGFIGGMKHAGRGHGRGLPVMID